MSLSTLRVARFPLSILIAALAIVGLLLFPGPAYGIQTEIGVVSGSVLDDEGGSAQYLLGETIVFPESSTVIEFTHPEEAFIHGVELIVSGPQGMTVNLPTAVGTFTTTQLPDPSQVVGDLKITVAHEELSEFAGYGYGYVSGYGYKSTATTARIKYRIEWTPPVLLDPAPTFSLITNGGTDTKFAIPELAAPAAITGTVLPNTDLEFVVPQVGAPSFGTVLPAVVEAWSGGAIPSVTISTNAPAGLTTALPNSTALAPYGFNIPSLSVASAPAGVATFPATSASFNIPSLSAASAPSGVPDAPEASAAYTIPASQIGRALGTDNTNFWVVSDDAGTGGVDLLVKLGADGAVLDPAISIDGPSSDVEGIAFLNNKLFVAESMFRCYDTIEPDDCENSHRIFQIDPSDPPTNNGQWKKGSGGKSIQIFSLVDPWEQIGGITAQGSGASGSLWITNQYGWKMYNVSQAGAELDSPNPDRYVESMDAIAFNSADNLLYTVDQSEGVITSWTVDGKFVSDYDMVIEGGSTTVPHVRGLTFKTVSSAEVLFMAANTGVVYQTFFPATVSTSPRGMTYSSASSTPGEALWVLVDAEPKDKLLKINPSTGALIAAFGTAGSVDAPSGETQGITFMGTSLWVIANDGDERNLYEVNSQTGVAGNGINLRDSAEVWDDLGGITNNGTNLIVHTRSFYNDVWEVNTSGDPAGMERAWPCCPSFNGVRGLAYHSGRAQYYGARGADLGIYNNKFEYDSNATLTQTPGVITDIRGMDFNGDVLYTAHVESSVGKISSSFLGTTVSTKPTGIAHTPSTSIFGDALYILVDAEPVDRIIKVDPSDGSLITDFSTDGAVDAPSGATAGMTFVDTGTASTSYLWIVANEPGDWETTTTLYKVNPTTGAQVGTGIVVNDVWGSQGAIANDGTNLILFSEDNAEVTTVNDTGQIVGSGDRWLCCPNNMWGANGFGRHTGRDQYFAVKGNGILTLSGDRSTILSEQTLSLDGSALSYSADVQGLAFDQDVAYIARIESGAGKISVSKLVAANTTDPLGLAFSPDGSTLQGTTIGEALWVLTDGSPLDVILKVNPSTGALITAFSADGAVDAPTNKTEGITYLDGYLWVISNNNHGDRKLYKIKATDGSLSNTYNLQDVWDDIGGVTNDGTNILLFSESSDQVWTVDQDGGVESQNNFGNEYGPGDPADSAAYRVDAAQVVLGHDGQLDQYVSESNSFQLADDYNPSGVTGIRGSTFNNGVLGNEADDILYVAHATGKISKSSVPGKVTNKPRALAYDADGDELYILVDGKGQAPDHIVVVDPDAGTVLVRDFEAPSSQSKSMTFLDGLLYVGYSGEHGMNRIAKLDPSTGADQSQMEIYSGTPIGMANNGEDLFTTEEGSGLINVVNPDNGDRFRDVFIFDPSDPHRDFFGLNLRGLAYDSVEQEYFAISGSEVLRVDSDGKLIASFETTGLGTIQGAVFVGNTLLLAETDGNSIQSALIPLPAVSFTNDPRGIATDGTSIFIAVDAEPVDKIMKVNSSGVLDTSFGESSTGAADGGAVDAPGTEVGDLAYINGALLVVTNDLRTFNDQGRSFSVRLPMLHEFNPSSGAENLEERLAVLLEMPGEYGIEPESILFDSIGALASDGYSLFLGVSRGENQSNYASGIDRAWFEVDPNHSMGFDPKFNASWVVAEKRTDAFNGVFPAMPGFSAFTFIQGNEFADDKRLVAAGDTGSGNSNALARMGSDDGVVREQHVLTGTDIQGIALMGIDLLLADDVTDSILATSLPERTVEQTVVGSYSALLRATVALDGDTLVNENSASPAIFGIDRSSDIRVSLNLNDNFVVTSETLAIQGKVSDPSVTSVDVSVQLPFTTLFNDEVKVGTSEALWNRTSNGYAVWHINENGDWRFAVEGTNDFGNGSSSSKGGIALASPVDVADDTNLQFRTAYNTQPDPGNDKKLIQLAVVGRDIQGNDTIGPFTTIAAIVGEQFVDSYHPDNAHSSFQFLGRDPAMPDGGSSNQSTFDIPLGAFSGERVVLRFLFDSVNEFSNQGLGWVLLDVKIVGAGAAVISVPVTRLETPVTQGQTTYFSTFITDVKLAEGPNVVSAKAVQPYSPFISGENSRSGFLDLTVPKVSLTGISPVVRYDNQTLTVAAFDPTFRLVEVAQAGQLIFASTAAGEFDISVGLAEGTTVFDAIATDSGGLVGSTSLTIKADFTPPAITVGYRPILNDNGVRAGDPFFIMVDASDTAGVVDTGIGQVTARLPNGDSVLLAEIDSVDSVVVLKHGLGNFDGNTTTHVGMALISEGTPVGQQPVVVDAMDGAGNAGSNQVLVSVVAGLGDRSVYLGAGSNYVGFPLVLNPDDLLTLLDQEITNVNPQLVTDLGRAAILSDVIDIIYGHRGGTADFFQFIPGSGGANTLDKVSPFDGLIVNVKANVGGTPVFTTGSVLGTTVRVPIKWNATGVFQAPAPALPPSKDFAAGFNLWSPYATQDGLFEEPGFLRAAIVTGSKDLAVSAITQINRIDAILDTSKPGNIGIEIENRFQSSGPGNTLTLMRGYWTYMVAPATITP